MPSPRHPDDRRLPRALCLGVRTTADPGGRDRGPVRRAAPSSPTPLPDLGPPNVVLVVADDLGWGDLGSYGNRVIRTPNLDRLAAEGARYTTFYVPTPICAASRAGLLTGRFPWARRHTLEPAEAAWTGARSCSRACCTTAATRRAAVGKWHLGWDREEMPIHHGFDFYYGLPAGEDETDFILGDLPTKDGVRPDQLARRYTEDGHPVHGITAARPSLLHVPRAPRSPSDNYPAPEFAGRSAAGAYGDVIEQLDAWVGELMKWLHGLRARPEHARDLHERQRPR